MSTYTPFPQSFPAFAIIDAFTCIKDGAVTTPAGKLQLAHSAYDVIGWALHVTTEDGSKATFSAPSQVMTELTDDEAMDLMKQAIDPPDLEPGRFGSMIACPITPAQAFKLAKWLLKAAGFVLPILL